MPRQRNRRRTGRQNLVLAAISVPVAAYSFASGLRLQAAAMCALGLTLLYTGLKNLRAKQ
jgi:hypothetical protein